MNRTHALLFFALVFTGCSRGPEVLPARGMSPGKPQAPVEAYVLESPSLHVGVPAQLLLDVRTGIATAGVEVTIEGDAGLSVVDYAPKLLPATRTEAGHHVLVDVVPTSGGSWRLTARLIILVGGERLTRLISLPLAVAGPVTVQPAAEKPSEPPVRDASGELVRPMPAETNVRDSR